MPLTLHVTAVFVVPVTVAVNSCIPLRLSMAVVGATITATGGAMVIIAVATSVGSATLVAVRVTVAGLGTVAGAKYSPLEFTVPTVEFPPAIPFTL
jgi:hypothetical protein